MSARCILIGMPDYWSETSVGALVDRLITDCLPEVVSVAVGYSEDVDVSPQTTTLVRKLGDDDVCAL